MKQLLARLRRLWEFAGCQHASPHCLHLPVQKEAGGPIEILHVHLCAACGLCVHFEVIPATGHRMTLPFNRHTQPAPGDERWN